MKLTQLPALLAVVALAAPILGMPLDQSPTLKTLSKREKAYKRLSDGEIIQADTEMVKDYEECYKALYANRRKRTTKYSDLKKKCSTFDHICRSLFPESAPAKAPEPPTEKEAANEDWEPSIPREFSLGRLDHPKASSTLGRPTLPNAYSSSRKPNGANVFPSLGKSIPQIPPLLAKPTQDDVVRFGTAAAGAGGAGWYLLNRLANRLPVWGF